MDKVAIEKRELPEMVLVANEAAKVLKISTNTMYKLIREGKIKALKLGRLKIPIFEIERFLRDNLGEDLSEYVC